VLEHGRVVEQGQHEQLLLLNGVYRQLWDKQTGMSISEDGFRVEIEPARLRAVSILQGLDDALLAEIAERAVTENVMEERLVIQEGDPGEKFYVIVWGKVAVTRMDGEGRERRLAVLHDGDHFGEIALLKNVPRTATVRTLTPCVFLTLQRGQFLTLLQRRPHLLQTLQEVHLARIATSAAQF